MGLPATANTQQQLHHPLCSWTALPGQAALPLWGAKDCYVQHQQAVFVSKLVLLPVAAAAAERTSLLCV